MKRLILICSVLLLVQTGLVMLTHWTRQGAEIQTGKGPLLMLTGAEVGELLLEDGEGRKLMLKKENNQWILPESASFPADAVRVQGLIDRLTGLQRGWPEATTAEAAVRFKVAPDRFERKLRLRKDGSNLATVYFGGSPGLRKMYTRLEGDPEIQTLTLPPHELEVNADSWIDTDALRLKPEEVTRIELPGLRLERTSDGLQPVNLNSEEEEVVSDRRDMLVKRLTGLKIAALLGKEGKSEYGLDNPALRYTVEGVGGGTVDYLFGQLPKPSPGEGNEALPPSMAEHSFVLKVSNQEQLFRVEGWQVEEIKNATRTTLVRAKAQPPADSQPPPSVAAPEQSQ